MFLLLANIHGERPTHYEHQWANVKDKALGHSILIPLANTFTILGHLNYKSVS
jgi:hypothetical protein